MNMKKILYSLLIFASVAFVVSCADDSLDPLNLNQVKKGTILALRGTQLDNIYGEGLPGAEFFPRIINGTEKFEFDAEFLAEDPSSLESFDIYVIKKTKVGNTTTRERVFLKNVPASEFKTTDDYRNPWVSVSLNLVDILEAIGIDDYEDQDNIDLLLDTYKFGINIESDLNLKDGSKVLASNIVAAGLFASDQFYPAQILTYTVTDFCAYDAETWGGTFVSNEIYSNGAYGPYDVNFVQDGVDPNKYHMDNFWDYGLDAYIVFTPAVDNPDDQIVVFPEQMVDGVKLTGTGTYDQCKQEFKIQVLYGTDEWRYEFKRP
jgi:hypothetical protein